MKTMMMVTIVKIKVSEKVVKIPSQVLLANRNLNATIKMVVASKKAEKVAILIKVATITARVDSKNVKVIGTATIAGVVISPGVKSASVVPKEEIMVVVTEKVASQHVKAIGIVTTVETTTLLGVTSVIVVIRPKQAEKAVAAEITKAISNVNHSVEMITEEVEESFNKTGDDSHSVESQAASIRVVIKALVATIVEQDKIKKSNSTNKKLIMNQFISCKNKKILADYFYNVEPIIIVFLTSKMFHFQIISNFLL